MKRYLINSAVITSFGDWRYEKISAEQLINLLNNFLWKSHIGYEETAKAIKELTGFTISLNRETFQMKIGDVAIVFRLVFPTGTDRHEVLAAEKIGRDFILANCEIGLLMKVKEETTLELIP